MNEDNADDFRMSEDVTDAGSSRDLLSNRILRRLDVEQSYIALGWKP